MTPFAASVVIPAHQEEQSLAWQLSSLVDQDFSDSLHIVVVVNGSADRTAEVASNFIDLFAARGDRLEVVETAKASKAAALNLGDDVVTAFPRVYLDADIKMPPDALRRTIEELRAVDTPLLAAPAVRVVESAGYFARHYGRLWSELPYIRTQVAGVGFYAVNQAGRERWWRFPTLVGCDDKWARLHFGPDEARVIGDTWFDVFMPRRAAELVRVRGRWTSLNMELRQRCPRLAARDPSRRRSSLRYVLGRPSTWLNLPAFLFVWAASWPFAWRQHLTRQRVWARASTSAIREAPAMPTRTVTSAKLVRPTRRRPERRSRTVRAVVVTHESRVAVRQCLKNLLASEGLDRLDVTVVDNASTDGTAELVRGAFPDVEVIANPDNAGFARAANRGLEGETSTWCLVLNPDALVATDTIARCLDHLEENPADGMCTVAAIHADGTVNDRSFFMRPTLWSELCLLLGAHRLAPGSRLANPEQHLAHRPADAPFHVDILAGCFTLVDRTLWDRLGGYDERFFLCGEDFDLGSRAAELGASPVVVPTEPIVHHSGHSFSTSADARVAYLRGRAQFQQIWWSPRRAAAARAIRLTGVGLRVVGAHLVRSPRADHFDVLWARRDEWPLSPLGSRRGPNCAVRDVMSRGE